MTTSPPGESPCLSGVATWLQHTTEKNLFTSNTWHSLITKCKKTNNNKQTKTMQAKHACTHTHTHTHTHTRMHTHTHTHTHTRTHTHMHTHTHTHSFTHTHTHTHTHTCTHTYTQTHSNTNTHMSGNCLPMVQQALFQPFCWFCIFHALDHSCASADWTGHHNARGE